ncbi:hypothetical protein EYF80_059067 [Liparis tanakae]|uniref:Uncharacterized protein n=1 Tax=Liparis tanakae TaxID=230148 RepID=A0A4Z2EQ89_9TELE|nr:hypothetical protein EYF80_059067 [Liparis tanakae]
MTPSLVLNSPANNLTRSTSSQREALKSISNGFSPLFAIRVQLTPSSSSEQKNSPFSGTYGRSQVVPGQTHKVDETSRWSTALENITKHIFMQKTVHLYNNKK